jgi:ketol-acid reductoisomerase
MERLKKVAVLQNQHEARLIDDLLTERGIPHQIKSYHDSALDGLFQITKGWGHVEAPEEFKDEIKTILESLPGTIIEDEGEDNDEDSL